MPDRLPGRVHHCADGDGGLIDAPTGIIPFRLWGCDAPERGQHYFSEAHDFLAQLVLNQQCSFLPRHLDTYHRHIIQLFTPDGRDVSLELISAGLAWSTKQHAHTDPRYLIAFHQAVAHQLGLFSEKDAIPPWTFRHQKPNMHDKTMAPIKRRQKA
jgi:endonuclease YncB( thermonuclease family)